VAASRTALVIVHLSSIDSYAWHVGPARGAKLARAIAEAVRAHHGPVYIIDQNWDGPLRTKIIDAIGTVPATWLHFDEDVHDWNTFLPKLKHRLMRDRVERVIVGGIWYDPTHTEGCATRVYLYLRRVLPAKVDASIVGCATD
jgi:hypothetical protein